MAPSFALVSMRMPGEENAVEDTSMGSFWARVRPVSDVRLSAGTLQAQHTSVSLTQELGKEV